MTPSLVFCELITQVIKALADYRTAEPEKTFSTVMEAFLSALSVFFMQSGSFLADQHLTETPATIKSVPCGLRFQPQPCLIASAYCRRAWTNRGD